MQNHILILHKSFKNIGKILNFANTYYIMVRLQLNGVFFVHTSYKHVSIGNSLQIMLLVKDTYKVPCLAMELTFSTTKKS